MFNEEISKLRAAKQLTQQFQKEVDESYEEWRAQNESILARHEQAKLDMKEIEVELRLAVLDHYQDTGEKKPHPKLGVRVLARPVYNSEDAFEFAFNNVRNLLRLDLKMFESYARGVRKSAPLKFVEWEEKVIATIAKDLE